MATWFMDNHRGIYVDEPFDYMNKGEIAGRCRNMLDRYDTGINADAVGDDILVGGILPPNLVVLDAWIKCDLVLDAGVTLELLAQDTRTESPNDSFPGTILAEGAATTIIPATAFDVVPFLRMDIGNSIVGKRLGFPEGKVGTQFMIKIGGAPITIASKITVMIMYASD